MPRGNKADDASYDAADSGASKTIPKQCSALRKNEPCMIKGHPCKIVDMSTSKTGKHGHAKIHLVGLDIFDGKKYEDICPSTHNMEVPIVNNISYQVVGLNEEGYLSLMDDKGEVREDMKVPDDEVGTAIKANWKADKEVFAVLTSAYGIEKISGQKVGTK